MKAFAVGSLLLLSIYAGHLNADVEQAIYLSSAMVILVMKDGK